MRADSKGTASKAVGDRRGVKLPVEGCTAALGKQIEIKTRNMYSFTSVMTGAGRGPKMMNRFDSILLQFSTLTN